MNAERIILGIDPGTTIMGYGIIRINGKKLQMIALDVLKLDATTTHLDKLKKIFETTLHLIDTYLPDELAVEAPFFGKNVQSMLKLGRAQGVAMAAALYRSIPVYEYSPRKIKQSITGKGNASKEQVAAMLCQLLTFTTQPKYLDATDGLAAAVCHAFQQNAGNESVKYSGWKSFLAQYPEKCTSG